MAKECMERNTHIPNAGQRKIKMKKRKEKRRKKENGPKESTKRNNQTEKP